jgi:hypothetical protein
MTKYYSSWEIAKFKMANWLFRIYWWIGYKLFDEIRDIEMDYFKFYNNFKK